MDFDELVEALRAVEGLRDTGKRHPNFQYRSRPFLHFHSGERGIYADVRWDSEFEPVPASTPAERADLLERVRAHVADPSGHSSS
jgi:hypothetical protein